MIMYAKAVSAGIILGIGILLWSAAAAVPQAQANPKLMELEQKIADLSLLHQQLKDRMQQAQGLRAELADQQHTLASEIQLLMRSLKIRNLQQAQQHLRMRYNIELLRTVLSYMDQLDDKLVFYQAGRDRLGYLRQLAEDDMRMIAALNDLKIDALTTQISLVINRYLPEAHVIQIDPQHIKPLPAQSVWDRIVKAKTN